jgi:hypothetical protein
VLFWLQGWAVKLCRRIGHERASRKVSGSMEIGRVEVVLRSDREDQAQRLALQCREDAAKAGISSEDLEAAAEGNLIGNMIQALDDAEFRRMYRDQLADQEEDSDLN